MYVGLRTARLATSSLSITDHGHQAISTSTLYHGRLIRHAHEFSRHDGGSRFVGGDCLAGAQSHIKNYRWYDEHYYV